MKVVVKYCEVDEQGKKHYRTKTFYSDHDAREFIDAHSKPLHRTCSQLYVVIDPMFTNRNFALLFKEAYEQEYKLKCLVMSGYEYIKQKKKWKRVNSLAVNPLYF